MAHLHVWSCGVEGGWDSRGAVAILALLNQTSKGPFSGPGRAQPHSSSPVCLFKAQHASCQLLQEEWEFGLVTLLFRVVVAALSICGTRVGPTCVSRPGLCWNEAHSPGSLTRAKNMQCTSPGHERGAWDEHGLGKKDTRGEVRR